MDLSNIGNRPIKRRGEKFKPGLTARGGRNFDFSLNPIIDFFRLSTTDRVNVGTPNNRPGNYTVIRTQDRTRFYVEQRRNMRPGANYPEKASTIRLGGY